jgi:hypothetical protein
MTVVWLIAFEREALALSTSTSAPVCDVRGAIMFAPPPQMQDEERSIDIPADCFSVEINLFDVKNVVPGQHSPALDFSSSQEPAQSSTLLSLRLFFAERIPVPVGQSEALPRGVRSSLERPPRS